MPFALVSAPSTFQRLMDHVLQEMHRFTAAYLDNILIHKCELGRPLRPFQTIIRTTPSSRTLYQKEEMQFCCQQLCIFRACGWWTGNQTDGV